MKNIAKKGLVGGLAIAVMISASIAVGCSVEQAEEETGSSEGALRQECSLSSIEDKNDIELYMSRNMGDRFSCQVIFSAYMVVPHQCTREYTVTLYNGDGTRIIDRDRCRDCVKGSTQVDEHPDVQDPDWLRVPRGATVCRVAKFEEEFSANDRVRRLCFTCPVQCSAPDC